jgi:hypothetical protein
MVTPTTTPIEDSMRDDIYDLGAYQRAIDRNIKWNARKTREKKWREDEPELSAQLDDLYNNYPTDTTTPEYKAWARTIRAMPSFIFDSLQEWGGLTPKQADVARAVFERQGERQQAWDEAEAERRANAPAWEEGRTEFGGKIISAKLKEQDSYSYYSGTTWVWKMTVLLDDGRKLWCSAPAKLLEQVTEGDASDTPWAELDKLLRGRYVILRASVTPSDDDPTFGFGKRPFLVGLEDRVEQNDG